MAKSLINLGSLQNDGTGDPLRTAGEKINSNFDEIYEVFGNGSSLNSTVGNAVTAMYAETAGIATFAQKLSGSPNITVGIVTVGEFVNAAYINSSNINVGIITATGFISAANTTPISITLLGDQLTFTAVGIGSTTFTLA